MVHASRTVLLLHSFLVLSVEAGRTGTTGLVAALVEDKKLGAEEVRELFSQEQNSICGGQKIRKMLTEVPSEGSFRCSKWSSIEAEAEAYLKQVAVDIDRLIREVERLNAAIDHAREKSAPQPWDMQGGAKPLLESALIEAYTSDKSQEPLGQIAGQAKCGRAPFKLRKQLGVPSGSYNRAVELIKTKLEEVFQPGETRVSDGDNEALLAICAELTGWDRQTDDPETYCDELCSTFGSQAILLSGQYGGSYAGPGVDELTEQLNKATADLKYSRDEQDECNRAKASLHKFSEELDALSHDITVKHGLRVDAQDALEEAMDAMDEMQEQKDSMVTGVETALGKLQLTQDRKEKLTAALEDAKAKQVVTDKAVTDATAALDAATVELAKAERASVALDEIKGLVSQSLLRMWTYYEIVIVNPVLALGLQTSQYIEEFFEEILSEDTPLDEKQGVFDALTEMDEFCANTARAAFEKVQESVDLTPICPQAQVADISNAVEALVKARATAVKEALQELQMATQPYRGQDGMSDEESNKMVAMGEPEGLRKIASIFAESSYYSKYVSHWKVDAEPPKFLELLAALKTALASLEEQEGKMKTALKQAEDAAAAQLTAIQKLGDELKEATDNNEIAQNQAAEAQELLTAHEEQMKVATGNLDELKRLLAEADKAYLAARAKLVEVHKQGTNVM